MQIYNNPFEQKTNRNDTRSNQTMLKSMQALSKNTSANNVKQTISTLVKGQVIKGLVLNVSNKQVTLEMENGEQIQASVKEAVDLNIGEQLYFEVKDESANQIQLRPLTDPNISPQNATIEKVLNSNGLMLNEKNLSIVSELMDQGMNLDDATIRTIIRNSTKFPEASIKSLVLMEKLQLPVNETNLAQFMEYEEGNGMILKQTEDFIEQFCNELQDCKNNKGFEAVSQKLTQIMNETNDSVTNESKVLQKIHQVIEDSASVQDTKVLEKINDIIRNEYTEQADSVKSEAFVQKDVSNKSEMMGSLGDVIAQSKEIMTKEIVSSSENIELSISKGLMANKTDGFGISLETKSAQILDKINQIIEEEYPKEIHLENEKVMQTVRREQLTENRQEISAKMIPEGKDAQVLNKITQVIQQEYIGEIKDSKGESLVQKNAQTGKAEQMQILGESIETKILDKISQLIQGESEENVNQVKGETVAQKGQVESATTNMQEGNVKSLSEIKEIDVIQKINRIIKEEYLGEVNENQNELSQQKENNINQTENYEQTDSNKNGIKDSDSMYKSAKINQDQLQIKSDELMKKITKVVKEENFSPIKENRILQKLNDAIQTIENQTKQNDSVKGTPITIRFHQLVQKDNLVPSKENQLIQKFEQVILGEKIGGFKESQLLQKLEGIVKDENLDISQTKNITHNQNDVRNSNNTINQNNILNQSNTISQNNSLNQSNTISQNNIINQNNIMNQNSIMNQGNIINQNKDYMLQNQNRIFKNNIHMVQNQKETVHQSQQMNVSQIQTNDVAVAEYENVSKETQLIQKINQMIQIETENINLVSESEVESLVQEIKQLIQDASLEGNFGLKEALNRNKNVVNQNGNSLDILFKNPENIKQSQFFEDFDVTKVLAQTSSKTVEQVLSHNATFQDVLDSFLDLANQPLFKGQISQDVMHQITDIYASDLPKEEMVSKIEQILVNLSNETMGGVLDDTKQTPKQSAQKMVEFMDQMELAKDSQSKPLENQDVGTNQKLLGSSNQQNISQKQNLHLNQNSSQNGNQNQNTSLDMIANNVFQTLESELSALREFLQSRGFNDIVKGALQERWYVEPENLKDDFKVKEQIRKIASDLNQISSLFEKDGGFQKTAELSNQIKDNIDFMNQVNQYYNYVQIPLKLTEQLTNSELYVYTNKKNLKKNDGQISVLLHLDMKNLGSTDIHVALTNQSIHTRFYLEDDESLQVLENYVNELETAIQKLGYSMTYEMNVREQMPSFSENLLEEKPKQDIKRYNFDVRM